jgi:hypothetical protein
MRRKLEMRSPLTAKPLRNPGQSINWQIMELLFEKLWLYFTFAIAFGLLAVHEWLQWLQETPPKPLPLAIIAGAGWAFFIYQYIRVTGQARELKQGRDGEIAVGQYLERLREQGATVFHDVPAKNFNVDHVVIGRQGIFVIETKTLSKPAHGKAEITVSDGKLYANGRELERNPVEQARAIGHWARDLLYESTGKKFPTRPVVLFPGWFVQPFKNGGTGDVWVLNPKALPAFIAGEADAMSPEDVKLAAYHLSRYIRTYEEAT